METVFRHSQVCLSTFVKGHIIVKGQIICPLIDSLSLDKFLQPVDIQMEVLKSDTELSRYRKNPKISDTRKFIVIALKVEQDGISLE